MLQRQIDVVVAVHQTPTGVVVHLERQRHIAARHRAILQAHGHFTARLLIEQLPQQLNGFLRHNRSQHAVLRGVAVENVGETRRNHHAETVIVQRPHGMFTRRADAEIRSGNENLALLVFRLVEHEFRIATPCVEQRVVKTGLLHALQKHGGNNLVGIDVGAAKRHGHAGKSSQFFHFNISFDLRFTRCRKSKIFRGFQGFPSIHRSAGDEMVPRMAVAAATAGDAKCVRDPLP